MSISNYKLDQLLLGELPELIEHGKEALNQFAIEEHQEAPFLEWALVSLSHFVTMERKKLPGSEAYLEMSSKALTFAAQLASPGTNGLSPEGSGGSPTLAKKTLQFSRTHLGLAHKDCLEFRNTGLGENLMQATTHLKLCVIGLIAARNMLSQKAA
jgi:hypothetical protein